MPAECEGLNFMGRRNSNIYKVRRRL